MREVGIILLKLAVLYSFLYEDTACHPNALSSPKTTLLKRKHSLLLIKNDINSHLWKVKAYTMSIISP
jgi:hypothetical protein